MKKTMCLLVCLVICLGCASNTARKSDRVLAKNVKVVPGAVRTVCIQTDPAKPDVGFLIDSLKAKLEAKGYKITGDDAVHTVVLGLNAFDMYNKAKAAERASRKNNMAGTGTPAGTAVGSAVSGNVLRTTSTGGTAGGLIGGGVEILGGAVSGSSKDRFIVAVDVKIKDQVSGQQHTVVNAFLKVKRDPQEPEVKEAIHKVSAPVLAEKIAALMP